MVSIQLDRYRKIQVWPQHGGLEQLRYINGIGWCPADEENWTDAQAIIGRVLEILVNSEPNPVDIVG